MSGVLEQAKIRIIFEFESTAQVEALLDLIGNSIDNEKLAITGTWSWAAEQVREFTAEAFDEPHDDK